MANTHHALETLVKGSDDEAFRIAANENRNLLLDRFILKLTIRLQKIEMMKHCILIIPEKYLNFKELMIYSMQAKSFNSLDVLLKYRMAQEELMDCYVLFYAVKFRLVRCIISIYSYCDLSTIFEPALVTALAFTIEKNRDAFIVLFRYHSYVNAVNVNAVNVNVIDSHDAVYSVILDSIKADRFDIFKFLITHKLAIPTVTKNMVCNNMYVVLDYIIRHKRFDCLQYMFSLIDQSRQDQNLVAISNMIIREIKELWMLPDAFSNYEMFELLFTVTSKYVEQNQMRLAETLTSSIIYSKMKILNFLLQRIHLSDEEYIRAMISATDYIQDQIEHNNERHQLRLQCLHRALADRKLRNAIYNSQDAPVAFKNAL